MAKVIDRLKAQLNTSSTAKKDAALYQVISQLIGAVQSIGNEAEAAGIVPDLVDASYVTVDPNIPPLPNSRQLVAGSNVSLDTSTPGQIGIDVTIPPATYYDWDVLTNGDPVTPELVFAGGEVVMIRIP